MATLHEQAAQVPKPPHDPQPVQPPPKQPTPPEPVHAGRDRADLCDAYAELQKAKAKLAELERGLKSAREKSWDLSAKAEQAQETLAKLQHSESSRLASAWVADDTVNASPIPAAEHALAQARQALEDIHKIESAIASEIPKCQHRLNDVERHFYGELAEAVCSSPEYESLRKAHTDAWRTLRTVRECLKVTHSALRGACPQAYLDAGQRSEPSFRAPGFQVEESVVRQWAEALANLASDPDNAKLPSM